MRDTSAADQRLSVEASITGGRIRQSVLVLVAIVATGAAAVLPAMADSGSRPFQRTEQREACLRVDPLRQPFFGDLHSHSQYSLDAAVLDIRNTPRDAYAFAKGLKVGLPPFINTLPAPGPSPSGSGRGVASSHPYCFPGERCSFMATHTIQLPPGRALDFAAVTDHAEFFGEANICFFEVRIPCPEGRMCGAGQVCNHLEGRCVPAGYMAPTCILAREDVAKARPGLGGEILYRTYLGSENPVRARFCGPGGQACQTHAHSIWQEIQAAAEAAYDRTSACTFTSFVGYEYTASPSMGRCSADDRTGPGAPCWENSDCRVPGQTCRPVSGSDNLHRNIIFRNATVPTQPVSNLEAPVGCGAGAACGSGRGPLASPKLLLERLESRCVDDGSANRCQFLSIPHNSNLSGGAMFLLPESLEEARLRRDREPLVELIQAKGQSECRFSPARPGAWNTADEFCDFENLRIGRLDGEAAEDPDETTVSPLGYVRNALKSGLRFQQETGVNPFPLGFVGGTDHHLGAPGAADPLQFAQPGTNGYLPFSASGLLPGQRAVLQEMNPGGLTGIWAEENSRDSLFEALRRRETFATSGTRPVIRFFGGFGLPADMCEKGNFARKGYAHGVPMGGTLSGPAPGSPRFAVAATMDPGWVDNPGTPLQQIQIIKGWVDQAGETHERVYPVAGNPTDAGAVDLGTCALLGQGAPDLCAEWSDPDFDPDQHAFYYARVLENKSCRSSQRLCNAREVDCRPRVGRCTRAAEVAPGCPLGAGCRRAVACSDFEYELCCSGQVPKVVQQRAWTSPIWYSPTP